MKTQLNDSEITPKGTFSLDIIFYQAQYFFIFLTLSIDTLFPRLSHEFSVPRKRKHKVRSILNIL